MILTADLKRIARARLQDAQTLYKSKRYDGAVYICGYAVEVALKARICQTLKWSGYPETNSEFSSYQSFKVHNLDVLLHLSGIESVIHSTFIKQWSDVVNRWTPEMRYKRVGTTTQADALLVIASVRMLIERII